MFKFRHESCSTIQAESVFTVDPIICLRYFHVNDSVCIFSVLVVVFVLCFENILL